MQRLPTDSLRIWCEVAQQRQRVGFGENAEAESENPRSSTTAKQRV